MKLAEPAYEQSLESICARVADLEKQLANGVTLSPAPKAQAEDITPAEDADTPPWDEASKPLTKVEPVSAETPPTPVTSAAEVPQDTDPIISRFEDIKEFIRAHGGAPVIPHMNRATPMMLKGKFSLVFAKDAMMNKTVVARAGNIEMIQLAIQSVTGCEVPVQCLSEKEAGITADGDAFERLLALGKEHKEIEIL